MNPETSYDYQNQTHAIINTLENLLERLGGKVNSWITEDTPDDEYINYLQDKIVRISKENKK